MSRTFTSRVLQFSTDYKSGMFSGWPRATAPATAAVPAPPIQKTESHELFRELAESLREPVLLLAADGRVVLVNRAFLQTFGMTERETAGRLVFALGDGEWNTATIRRLLEDVMPATEELRDLEVCQPATNVGSRRLLLNARTLTHRPGSDQLTLLAIEDVTERDRLQNALDEATEALWSLQRRLPVAARGLTGAVQGLDRMRVLGERLKAAFDAQGSGDGRAYLARTDQTAS